MTCELDKLILLNYEVRILCAILCCPPAHPTDHRDKLERELACALLTPIALC